MKNRGNLEEISKRKRSIVSASQTNEDVNVEIKDREDREEPLILRKSKRINATPAKRYAAVKSTKLPSVRPGPRSQCKFMM